MKRSETKRPDKRFHVVYLVVTAVAVVLILLTGWRFGKSPVLCFGLWALILCVWVVVSAVQLVKYVKRKERQ